MKKILLGVFGLIVLLLAIVLIKTFTFTSKQIEVEAIKPVELSPGAIERFAGAIPFKTISYKIGEISDTSAFLGLHNYINETFPLVDSLLDKQNFGLSLLYTWPGTDPELKPIILMSHQDVVPIDGPTSDQWEHNPFSGDIADGQIWGRGTMDDKGTMIATLEAVEMLLNSGYQTKRTIYLAFGHDEEVGGKYGAKLIADHLESQGVKAEFTLDEGGVMVNGMVPGMNNRMALINVAEKGYVSMDIVVKTQGGHSSSPPEETTIEKLARAIVKIDENQFPYKMEPPVSDQIAAVGPELSFVGKMAFANTWLFKKQVLAGLNARTSTVPTIIEGGVKDNVIPTEAKVTVNFRIMPGETVSGVKAHLENLLDDPAIAIIPHEQQTEPSPVSRIDSEGYKMLVETIRGLFPKTAVVPGLLPAGTDSKHFQKISDDVYRFFPIEYTPETSHKFHGINESLPVENYKELVRFVYHLIERVNESE